MMVVNDFELDFEAIELKENQVHVIAVQMLEYLEMAC